MIEPAASPAHQVAKPRRLPNTRRALTADELEGINTVARTGGNDVVLDALLLRLHTERPVGVVALSVCGYDQLWKRIGERLPWVAVHGISTHWLRHTTLTWVERRFGYCVARAYAGHTDSSGPATTTYIKANICDVASALAALMGQTHPLTELESGDRRW